MSNCPAVVRSGKVVEEGTHAALMQMQGTCMGWPGGLLHSRVCSVSQCAHAAKLGSLTCSTATICTHTFCPSAGGFYRGLVARQQLVAEADESGLRSKFGGKWLAATQQVRGGWVQGGGGRGSYLPCYDVTQPLSRAVCLILGVDGASLTRHALSLSRARLRATGSSQEEEAAAAPVRCAAVQRCCLLASRCMRQHVEHIALLQHFNTARSFMAVARPAAPHCLQS